MIVAAESGAHLRVTSGPAIQHAGDLAALLMQVGDGEVLLIDEIHRMARTAVEMLYLAMEDFRVDVVLGKGPGATAVPLEVPPFTLVGATTRSGTLPAPLRDRFGFTAHVDFYAPEELERIVTRSAVVLGVGLDAPGAAEIAGRSRGTPRIANRLLRRVRDYAQVHGDGTVDRATARAALLLYEVDERGLDRLDRAVLHALVVRFAGGPVGCRPSRSPSARSARPSRRSPSRSWCVRACWPVRAGVGWPLRRRGSTWACRRPEVAGPTRRNLDSHLLVTRGSAVVDTAHSAPVPGAGPTRAPAQEDGSRWLQPISHDQVGRCS